MSDIQDASPLFIESATVRTICQHVPGHADTQSPAHSHTRTNVHVCRHTLTDVHTLRRTHTHKLTQTQARTYTRSHACTRSLGHTRILALRHTLVEGAVVTFEMCETCHNFPKRPWKPHPGQQVMDLSQLRVTFSVHLVDGTTHTHTHTHIHLHG